MSGSSHLVGVDVGGTFTDLVAYGPDGVLHSAKVPSLPGEQWRGVLDALASLGVAPGSLRAFVHGTTIATNALLERKGARTGLVTTEGFRDLLEIGKGRRLVGGLFDPGWQRPAPLARLGRLIDASRAALVGWRPEGCVTVLVFRRGRLQELGDGRAIWSDEYHTRRMLAGGKVTGAAI